MRDPFWVSLRIVWPVYRGVTEAHILCIDRVISLLTNYFFNHVNGLLIHFMVDTDVDFS
jgi:hypothetical protein